MDPAASGRSSRTTKDPLTLADISALHLAGGLAYLSACEPRHQSHASKQGPIHITASIHLAGYQYVIGTLWPIETLSRATSPDFYDQVAGLGTSPPDTSLAPLPSTTPTRRLRDTFPAIPSASGPRTLVPEPRYAQRKRLT